MQITLAVLQYRDTNGNINYGLSLADCIGRMEKTIPGLESFDHLCLAIREAIVEWHMPRRKPPANLEIIIRDEAVRKGKLTLPQGAMPLSFTPDKRRKLSLVALTATADAAA